MKVVAAIIGAILLAGCANEPEPTVRPSELRLEDFTEGQLIELGELACDGLESGLSKQQVEDILTENRLNERHAELLIETAQETLCPETLDSVV